MTTTFTPHIAPKPGFPEYGSGTPDILFQCDCTSLAALSAAGLAGSVVGAGAGTVDFNDNGVLLNATAGILWTGLSTAQKNALAAGGTFTFWIESGWFSSTYSPAVSEYGLGCRGAKTNAVLHVSATPQVVPFMYSTMPASAARGRFSQNGKATHTRVDLTWFGNKAALYVDYFQGSDETMAAQPLSTEFANITLGGNNALPNGPSLHRIKNVMISTKPITLPVSYALGRVDFCGHSYMSQSDYPATNASYLGESYNSFGVATGGPYLDTGAIPTLHRSINARGIGIGGGKIHCHGYGGARLLDPTGGLKWQLDIATTNNQALSVLGIMWGANEVAQMDGTNDWAYHYGAGGSVGDWINDATYGWVAQIDRAIAAGANTIFVSNVVSLVNNTAINTTPTLTQYYKDAVDAANVMIDTVIALYPSVCVKVDMFTAFGGHSSPITLWGGSSGTDYEHPNGEANRTLIGGTFINAFNSIV